jgi:Type IV secretion-system coupling protein DNA-binding domain
MFSALTHGLNGLLLGYLVTSAGLYMGFRRMKIAAQRRLPQIAVLAVPVMIGMGIANSVLQWALSPLFKAIGETLSFLSGMAVVYWGSVGTAVVAVRRTPSDVHKRGTRLLDGLTAPSSSDAPGQITLAGQAIPELDETKHFKIIGTTGTGKSTAIRELLVAALRRGDRAVIADPDGGYIQEFFDAARGDVVLSPFARGAARWDLFAEITELQDADQLARALIPDYEGTDRSWRQYGRTFLASILRQLHRAGEKDLAKLYWLLMIAPVDELRELLDLTPAAPFLGSDNGKFFESVRSITAAHVASIEHFARQITGEPLSIRKWVVSGKGVLFLPYRASEIASLRHAISAWMRLAIFQAMEPKHAEQRLWFIVDELDAMGAIDGLKDALARLRKFGGRCVLGLQSIAQVRGIYGDAEAQTIVENCGNTLILRCSASERGGTSEFASRLIGKREIIRPQFSVSRPADSIMGLKDVRTTNHQHTLEDAVLPSEIEQLPDLSGFLKIASGPEWIKVRLKQTSTSGRN